MLIFTSDEWSNGWSLYGNFPKYLPVIRSNDRVCLGALQFLNFLFRISVLCHCRILSMLQLFLKTLFGNPGLIITVLAIVHGQFEKLLVILSIFPAIFIHFLSIFIQSIRIIQLRVGINKFISFRFRQLYNLRSELTRKTSTFTQNHIPSVVIYHCPAIFSFYLLHKIH